MIFDVITIFPDIFKSFLAESLLAKAIEKNILEVRFTNPRDFAADRHHTADDRPYGGGPGMVMKPEPLAAAIEAASARGAGRPRRIYLSPSGRRLTQEKVEELSGLGRLILVCGRYEGLDQRVIDLFIDEEISIGDYVVNGGEAPAMVLIEATARLLPGFMGKMESAAEESHQSGLLEYPHYTRPPEFRGLGVPERLLSGDHKDVARWRLAAALARTLRERPEMLAKAGVSPEALKILPHLYRAEAAAAGRPAAAKNAAKRSVAKKS
ncbi:MAG: tRNA (guanosine(37)-N1)-methyltransferase TrmD [Candidatus Adiutrix sp.]|jgi:tRNA (guanine37-N1)-methyltransferase|nr:tRNA (guanosine(37)-N1)-methyltransferase TrmD [Candidatus Adiutrix sp.]